MEIKQKKNDHKLIFTFDDKYLKYDYKYKSGSGTLEIPYVDFPNNSIIHIERNEWCNNVGWIWILLGFVYNLYDLYSKSLLNLVGMFAIVVGILCLIWRSFRKVEFTIFETPHGSVLIIKNRKHDKIVNEILVRRKEHFLKLYGEIDIENTIEDEIKKFEWLKKEKILTSSETEEKILELKKFKKDIGFKIV